MRIAVNTRLLLPNRLEGIGRFTHETLQRMVKDHPEVQWIFLFDRGYDQRFIYGSNVTGVVLLPQARHPILWSIWFELMVPIALKWHNADLFLSPDGYNSLVTSVPSVDVIHDLNFEHNPNDVPGWAGRFLRKHFPKYTHKAKRLATVSEYSAQDICKTYGIERNKIDVVYNGVDQRFVPIDHRQAKAVKQKESDGNPYFLYVGSINPRKNIARMLKAFDKFRSNNSSSEHKLLLAGAKMVWTDEMEIALNQMTYKQDVVFKGTVSDERLADLLGAAEALVYVSYFEGFGIPVIEAFQAGIPVICSNVTSLPEVAGDAAILVDPMDIEGISKGMGLIFNDSRLRSDLINKGHAQSAQFTWDRSADLLWKCIEKALH